MIRACLALVIVVVTASSAYGQPGTTTPLRGRIGVEDRIDEPSLALAALDRKVGRSAELPLFVRLVVPWPVLQRASAGDWSAIDERLAAYSRRGIPVLLSIGPPDNALSNTDAWAPVIRSLAQRLRGRVAGYQIEAPLPVPDAREYAFQLRFASVQIRAVDPAVLVAQATTRAADAAWLTAVYAEGTAPYVDVAPIAIPNDASDPVTATSSVRAAIASGDPSAVVLQVGVELGSEPSQATTRLLAALFAQIDGSAVLGSTFGGAVDALALALAAGAELKNLLTTDVVAVDDTSVSLAIEAGGRDVTTLVQHRVLYDTGSGGTYLVYWGTDSGIDRLTISVADRVGRPPILRDPLRRETGTVQGYSWDQTTQRSRTNTRSAETPLVLDFTGGSSDSVVSRVDVSTVAALRVEEIVARHQLAQAAQANAFKSFMATMRMVLHFRPSAIQVFDVISENRFFQAADVVEWEERSFSVNGAQWGPDRPGFPLLQAEKVLTLPLDLRLTLDYRYRLERVETVGDRPCYVIAFEPTDLSQSRYRGWIWIDTTTFLRAKVQSIQTELEGPIVSSEEIALYEPVGTSPGGPIVLATRLSTKQTILIAGRNLLLEKEQWFSDFRIDAPEFELERQAARSGPRIMFRETDLGVRYLVKRGLERVVSEDMSMSSKALAMGTTIDPTFAFPLPILGLNYLNFDLKGTGSQFALLFGGVFALGNLQTPKLGGTPFDASVDFFGIAVPGTDLRFDSAGERLDERVLNIPMSTGVNLGYQFTPFHKITAGYVFRYDAYFNAPETAEDFAVPSGTATNGLTVGYEFSRHGYRLGGSWAAYARRSWEHWGRDGDFDRDARTYRRYSARAAKDFLFGPFQSVNVSAAWYGGARLDRFSMYQFGLFDEVRMHGVPAAGIRFPELVMLRGSYSFNVFNIYRLDLFLDQAQGRDPFNRRTWRSVTGTGAAVTFKTPWNTMFTADVGKSFIPDLYRGTGSMVLQLLLLKPLSASR